MSDIYIQSPAESNTPRRRSGKKSKAEEASYTHGSAAAFAVNALSHLHSLRRKALNERDRIMQNQLEKAQATTMGQQLIQEEEERALQEQEQNIEQPTFLGNRLFDSQNG